LINIQLTIKFKIFREMVNKMLLLMVSVFLPSILALNNCPGNYLSWNSTSSCALIPTSADCTYVYEFNPDSRTSWTGIGWHCAYPHPEAVDQNYCVKSETACIPSCFFEFMKVEDTGVSSCDEITSLELCDLAYVDEGAANKWCMWDEYYDECIGIIPCHV
jgi:hypothetical protein